jgi:transcriptional regulator with XRE-family HTH domain
MEDFRPHVLNVLSEAFRASGLSSKALADKALIAKSIISKVFFTENYDLPKIETLQKIAKALGYRIEVTITKE